MEQNLQSSTKFWHGKTLVIDSLPSISKANFGRFSYSGKGSKLENFSEFVLQSIFITSFIDKTLISYRAFEGILL